MLAMADEEAAEEVITKVKIDATLKRLERDMEEMADIVVSTETTFARMRELLLREFDFIGNVNIT